MRAILVDNDVLHKTAAYGLQSLVLELPLLSARQIFALGAARFIIAKKLRKRPPFRGAEAAISDLEGALASVTELEPYDEEIELAAELEYAAQRLNLDFDTGESMLCAVLLRRGADYLLSGDKRAMAALQAMLAAEGVPAEVRHRLVCLEQIFVWLLEQDEGGLIRTVVCNEPDVDRALSNCFQCRSSQGDVTSQFEGLNSYINDLARRAPDILFTGA